MKYLLAAYLYLSIGHMAIADVSKVYPSISTTPMHQFAFCVYWPAVLIKMNVEHVLGQRPPRSRQWKGSV